MSELQDSCKKLHHVIKRIGEGADFMVSSDGITWVDVDNALSALSFLGSCEFKEKPRTIKIGDFDVPEPIRVEPSIGDKYFTFTLNQGDPVFSSTWDGYACDKHRFYIGICHSTKEGAELHFKALVQLGIGK